MASTEPSPGEKSAREAMEASRKEVMKCEEEIKSIKASLKCLPSPSVSTADADPSHFNALRVSVQKVTEGAMSSTTFAVQLSSPIEERIISKVFDPLDPDAEGSMASFEQVETSNALLTIEAFRGEGDEKKKVGVSAAHDLLPLCEGVDPFDKKGKVVSTIDFAIVFDEDEATASEGGATEEALTSAPDKAQEVTSAKESETCDSEDSKEKTSPEEGLPNNEEITGDETIEGGKAETEAPKDDEADEAVETKENETIEVAEAPKESAVNGEVEREEKTQEKSDAPSSQTIQLPICTLTVRLEYTPSSDDKRDALYDKLNKVAKRKASAIDALRKNAAAVSRAKAAALADASGDASSLVERGNAQAVKSGFLNKPKVVSEGAVAKQNQPAFLKRLYEKTIGPSSLLWVIGPIAKNYVIFVGCAVFFHYKGDLLALPPPV